MGISIEACNADRSREVSSRGVLQAVDGAREVAG